MPANNVQIRGSGAVSQDYIRVVESERKAQLLIAADRKERCDGSDAPASTPICQAGKRH
jgi:hypothetical protein